MGHWLNTGSKQQLIHSRTSGAIFQSTRGTVRYLPDLPSILFVTPGNSRGCGHPQEDPGPRYRRVKTKAYLGTLGYIRVYTNTLVNSRAYAGTPTYPGTPTSEWHPAHRGPSGGLQRDLTLSNLLRNPVSILQTFPAAATGEATCTTEGPVSAPIPRRTSVEPSRHAH